MMGVENCLRTISFIPEIFLNAPVQVGDCHILSEEPTVGMRAGTIAPYPPLFTPPPYRAGMYLENPGDIARGQHGLIRLFFASHRPDHLSTSF